MWAFYMFKKGPRIWPCKVNKVDKFIISQFTFMSAIGNDKKVIQISEDCVESLPGHLSHDSLC